MSIRPIFKAIYKEKKDSKKKTRIGHNFGQCRFLAKSELIDCFFH